MGYSFGDIQINNLINENNSVDNINIFDRSNFIFNVDGLDFFILRNFKPPIEIYFSITEKYKELHDKPNKFIQSIYNVDWIRYCARRCGVGGTPWWRFWDWDIFLSKPNWSK